MLSFFRSVSVSRIFDPCFAGGSLLSEAGIGGGGGGGVRGAG